MNHRAYVFCVAVALLLGAFLPQYVAAQGVTTSAVRGLVTANGAPAANVQITVRNVATGATRGTLTNAAGQYFVPNLLPGGPYSITASSLGYGAEERSGVQLILSQTTSIDFDLQTQAVALEGITVSAQTNPVLSRSRTGVGTVVGAEALEATPTISRNFTEVARLSPHVTGGSDNPSVGGANNRFNNIQIDGATSSDIFGLGSTGTPGGQGSAAKPIPLDAIAQFQVLVTPFDVRQAGFTGGLINAVTRSGTNDLRGGLFFNYRNEDFIRGDTIRGYGRSFAPPRAFTNQQMGATIGGPILRDQLHFFFSGEMETRETPGAFSRLSDPSSIGIKPETIDRVIRAAEGYGINPGTADPFTEEVRLGNLFGRLDYRLNDQHRFVLRHNFSPKLRDDSGPSRGGTNFDLSSYNFYYRTHVNSTVGQVFSDLSPTLSNELLVNFQRIVDRPTPEVRYPIAQITVNDTIGGITQRRTIRLGTEFSRQYNELDQDMFQVTNNLVWNRGDHRLTFGANAEYFSFRNAFVQNWIGQYQFNSVADYEAGRPSTYSRNVPLRGDPAAVFGVFQPGLYVQDEWTVTRNLNLTGGLRVDVPIMLDQPEENQTFTQAFGRSNSETPSGKALISPRLGFNWQSGGVLTTQLRGGVGMFSGRPPYVWLSNAFSNTGSDFALLNCTGAAVPRYTPETAQLGPTSCGTATPTAGIASVNLFNPGYRFPQELKSSLGVDQELPAGFTGTVEVVFTRGIDRTISREINLSGPQENIPASATQGLGPRTIYGRPQNHGDFAFAPVRVDNRFRHVVELDRLSAGNAYTIVTELGRSFGRDVEVRAAYTFNRSRDPGSFGSSVATSNVGLHPVGTVVNDFSLAPSAFERPHKVTMNGAFRLPSRFGGAEVSGVFIGQSGRNYYYVYQGDVNGDGYPGPGVTNRHNDLLYVPNNLDEMAFVSADDRRLFQELIDLEPCLQKSRGAILERFTCRGPWQQRLDMRVTQPVQLRGSRIQAELNLFNVANLLNSEWGLQQGVNFSDVFALDFDNRVVSNDPNSAPRFRYAGQTVTDAAGVRRAELPYTTFFDSRYQIQLGVRYQF
jgi:hypothetical protein